jgi:phage terminase large subunit-like protein
MLPDWDTSCLDWGQRLKDGRSIIPAPIFPEQAEQALHIFKMLKIVDAPGSPTFGESCAQWVFDLVAYIFGSLDPDTNRRVVTEFFICLPKKNSKSTIAAGIMLTALILNQRTSGEFAVIAPTIEVAFNAFSPARDMVAKDEDLFDLMQVQAHIKTITNRETGATLKVIAADSNTVSGKKSIGTLVEELWLFGKQPNAEAMLREAVGGLASRPEGFVIYVTTQSDDPPAGLFKQKLDYARNVRDGKIVDKGFLPVIFEHPDDMVASGEHLKWENLAMVNPNLGFSVDEQFLEREFKKAQMAGGDSFRGFLAKHGNVEIGMNLRSDRWAGADFWQQQAIPAFSLEELIDKSDVITVGIDGGGLDDLLGLAVVGRCSATRRWLSWVHAWAHPSVLERRKQEAARFIDFSNDNDLTLVDRIGDDVADVARLVFQIEQSGKLDKIGLDPAGIGAILDAMLEAGVPEEKIIGITQGWKLTGAIKTAERKLAEGVLVHGGQPMMAWCISNAKIEPRGNAVLITKQASGSAKIDPLMALFNALSLMSLNPVGEANIDDFLNNPIHT